MITKLVSRQFNLDRYGSVCVFYDNIPDTTLSLSTIAGFKYSFFLCPIELASALVGRVVYDLRQRRETPTKDVGVVMSVAHLSTKVAW